MSSFRFASFCVLVVLAPSLALPATFDVRDRWRIGGEGTWTRLLCDSGAHRLYVTRGDRVLVLNTDTGKPEATVEGLEDGRGLYLNPNGRFGYVTDSTAGALRVFDAATLKTISTIPTDANPDAIVLDTATSTIAVLNSRGHSLTFVNSSTNQAIGTLKLPGKPVAAATDNHGMLFVTLQDTGHLLRIDLRGRTIAADVVLPGCTGPNSLALGTGAQRLYAACENSKLLVLSARTGTVTASVPVPSGTRDLALDPKRNLLFAADSGGTLDIFRPTESSLVKLQSVKTMPGARSVAVDPGSGRAYVASAEFGLRTGEMSEELRFRPTPVPNSFTVLVVGTAVQLTHSENPDDSKARGTLAVAARSPRHPQ